MGASFVQTDFLGGEWSDLAQGRMTEPAYKSGLKVCYNAYALEAGGWTRRSGTRYLAHTKAGAAGKIVPFDFSITQPYQLEFTDGWVRFFAVLSLLSTNQDTGLADLSADTPAVVTLFCARPA